MQINVEGRNTEVQQSWRTLIESKLAKCERYPNEITHARVTITHSPHHQKGDNQVQVILSVSGRTLTVKKHGAQISTVLRSALLAAEREVEAYHQSRKRFVKTLPSHKEEDRVIPVPVPQPTSSALTMQKARAR